MSDEIERLKLELAQERKLRLEAQLALAAAHLQAVRAEFVGAVEALALLTQRREKAA